MLPIQLIYNSISFKEKIVLFFTAMLFVAQPLPFFNSKVAIFVLSAIGCWILLTNKNLKQNAVFLQLLTVFILLGVPGLVSLPGSYNIGKSTDFVLLIPLFFAAAISVFSVLRNYKAAQILSTVIAITSICWVLDALAQYTFGVDVLGIPLEDRRSWGLRTTGPFRDNNHLGMLLAVTLPVTLKWLCTFHKSSQLLYIGCLGFVLLVIGARTHWVTLIFAIIGYYWFAKGGRFMLFCGLIPAFILSIWIASSNSVLAEKKLGRFSSIPTSVTQLDKNLSGRVHIWATALNMGATHPLSGVGVKAFKTAYQDENLVWDPTGRKKKKSKVSHAHHQWISVFAETGLLGVASLLMIVIFVVYLTMRSVGGFNFYHYPWFLSFLLIMNPLNSMQPIFKMWWFPIVLLVIVAQLCAIEQDKNQFDCKLNS